MQPVGSGARPWHPAGCSPFKGPAPSLGRERPGSHPQVTPPAESCRHYVRGLPIHTSLCCSEALGDSHGPPSACREASRGCLPPLVSHASCQPCVLPVCSPVGDISPPASLGDSLSRKQATPSVPQASLSLLMPFLPKCFSPTSPPFLKSWPSPTSSRQLSVTTPPEATSPSPELRWP